MVISEILQQIAAWIEKNNGGERVNISIEISGTQTKLTVREPRGKVRKPSSEDDVGVRV